MLVTRERTEQRLRDAASHAALTMLRAPLGAGKTSAATAALANVPGVVWLSAQPWNRDAFVRDLVQQVRGVREEFGRLTLGALEAGADPEHVGRTFSGELARIDEPLTIVIDNAQVFSDDAAFVAFANAALEALPRAVHLVVLGRALPTLALGRTLSRGQVTVFDEQFLALDVPETIAFAKAAGRDLDEAAANELLLRTNGWVAGVMLMLAAPGGALPQAYLEEHLLPELGAANVALLEQLSVFETLDTRVLQQVPTLAHVGEQLATLRKLGAPIDTLSETRFRLHPLLRDLARVRLAQSGSEGAAHVQASSAYARAGNMAAALYHAELSNDAACAQAYLREHIEGAVATGNHARVRALAEKVSEHAETALSLYAQGLLEKANGNALARATFERSLKAATHGDEGALAFSVRAQLLEHDLGHLALVDRAGLDAFESASSDLGVGAVARAAIMRGWGEAISFDFAQAHARLEPLAGLGDESARFNTDILRAYVQTSLGDFDAAANTLDELTRLLEGSDRVVLQALTLVWFARLALVWGNTNAALDAASQAERIFDALDMRAEEAALYVSLAEIASHHGNVAAAVTYAEHARASADRAWYAADVGRVRAMAEIVLARAAFLGHDNTIARDLAIRVADRKEIPSAQRALALAEASVYTLLAKPGDADAIIARTREAIANAKPLDAADAVAIAIASDTIAFLDAANGQSHKRELPAVAAFAAMIDRRAGLVTLEHAGLAVGNERRGTSGSSVAFETALDRLTRDGPRFEVRLVRAYAATFIKQKAQGVAPAVDLDLTAREFEILALLVDGLSNKEIAARLVVSPRTIETHVERVLGKLEVGSRSRAIAKALRLGLVRLENP